MTVEYYNRIYAHTRNATVEDLYISNKNIVIQPIFQRNYVWDNEKASKLIETILLSFPIPSIYLFEKEGNYVVIDGQQRLTSIKNFLNNLFPLKGLSHYEQFNGLYYKELPQSIQNTVLNYILNLVIIKNVEDEKIIFDIFERFNTGGVHLNAQEIRNCIHNGPYTELIRELANYNNFSTFFNNCKIDRMEKEEYVLRFLALYEDFAHYNGNMAEFLDNYLTKKNEITNKKYIEENIAELRKKFKDSIDLCKTIFGNDAFKNCLIYKTTKTTTNIMYKSLSKPVFDFQMLGVAFKEYALVNRFAEKIKSKYEEVIITDENIRPYYKRMSRRALFYRTKKWQEYIDEIINQ